MPIPVINAIINFSTGPSFAQAMILDTGILDTNVLADAAAVIVDVSDQVNRIETNRGRTALSDQFQTGSLTLRIVDQSGDFNPQNVTGPYAGLLTPMKKVQITATYGSVTYPIFSGFITSYVTTYPKDAEEVAYNIENKIAMDSIFLMPLSHSMIMIADLSPPAAANKINSLSFMTVVVIPE